MGFVMNVTKVMNFLVPTQTCARARALRAQEPGDGKVRHVRHVRHNPRNPMGWPMWEFVTAVTVRRNWKLTGLPRRSIIAASDNSGPRRATVQQQR